MEMQSLPASSSRILYDVPCVVCRDHSSGKHYGVFACDGCAGFFKRSVRRDRRYACKARAPGGCLVDKAHRNQCRACRLAKCLNVGMNKDAVQHERGPRNSTIRRQMAMFLKDPSTEVLLSNSPSALDLALPKPSLLPPTPTIPLFHSPFHPYSRLNLLTPPLGPCPPMELSPPLPITSLIGPSNPEALCEAAARLLFMNVKWAKNVPAFASLSLPDRLLLLEESWRDLFVIGTAQFLYPLDLKVLTDGKKLKVDSEGVRTFENVLSEFAKICPNHDEYSCLRAVVLFKTHFDDKYPDESRNSPAEPKRLQDLPAVATLQDHSQLMLNQQASCGEPGRAGRVRALAAAAARVRPRTIEELFFRTTIGDIPIERIISDMYRTGKDPV